MKQALTPTGAIAYRGGDAIYLNITNRCSCACEFCLRKWTEGVFGESLVLDHEPDIVDVTQAIELEFVEGPAAEVVFCGFGEPTMRLDAVLAVSEWLRLRRIRVRLDTNGHGQLLNPDTDVPAALASAGMTAVTVSLNAAGPEAYDLICHPLFSRSHRAVIHFAEQCLQYGMETTLTAVACPDADLPGCEAIATALGAGFRIRSLVAPRTSEDADQKERR